MNRRDLLRLLGLGVASAAGAPLVPPATAATSPRQSTLRVYFTPAYVGAAHAFETTRKARWVADSLALAPIAGVRLVANAPLSRAQLLRVHDQAYVDAVRTGLPRQLAQSQGFTWDPGLWPMVLASNGGIVAAALAALGGGCAGALSSGLHHARRGRGAGFCTFNGLALAAHAAFDRGAGRILILDLDAHCGGGTHSLLGADPRVRQLDVAVDAFDHYVPRGGNTLDLVTDAQRYLPTIAGRLAELRHQPFDLCLYNAGMDPHQHCPVGGLPGIDARMLRERERMVFSWARRRRLPIAFTIAGGYIGPGLDQAGLVALHRLTLDAAAAR